jgi:hypothetical protein
MFSDTSINHKPQAGQEQKALSWQSHPYPWQNDPYASGCFDCLQHGLSMLTWHCFPT